jgi:hypothetical protein
MALIDRSPYEWLSFDENGTLTDQAAVGRVVADLTASGATDLVVISHGWKTNQVGAGELYTPLWQNVTQALIAHGGPAPQKIVVAGVLWPSKQFEDDFDTAAAQKVTGGTLAIPPAQTGDGDLNQAELGKVINGYRELVGQAAGDAIAAAAALNANGFTDASAADLLNVLKTSAGLTGAALDSELTADASGLLGDPLDILESLVPLTNLPVPLSVGATLDLGNVLSNAIQGPRAAVARLLNQFTYFTMKKRAGAVGSKLGSDVLPALASPRRTRLHLVGHSFGARLVTAAAASFRAPGQLLLESLTLLQGAYSHNGLSSNFSGGRTGAFASVLTSNLVQGRITMSHTHNDTACTIAYPLASRLSRDVSQDLGDASDLFGSMGANGAQGLAATAYAPSQAMAKGQAAYLLAAGKVNRILADACIREHMDVTNGDIGALVASTLRV